MFLSNEYFPFVPLSKGFIEKYMIKANPNFVIIYIYILKKHFDKEQIIINQISEKLDILETDVLKALSYWQENKALNYQLTESKTVNVEFLNFDLQEGYKKEEKECNYTEDEISVYSQQEEIQQIFRIVENKLAKTLSYQERKILIRLYDNYSISMEVMVMLLTYCIEKDKTNFNYIEKVAINWSENRIDSIEKVEAYIKIFDKDHKNIMQAFGIRNREPIKKEIEFMKKWIIEYKMPINLIEEACTRTILKTSNPSFEYANGIITNWHNDGVKKIEDIEELDKKFDDISKSKESQIKKRQENMGKDKFNKNATYSKNKFVNYTQPNLNFKELRELEIKALKEGIE